MILKRYPLSNLKKPSIVTIIIIILCISSLLFMFQRSNITRKTFIYMSHITYVNHGETTQNLDSTMYAFNIFMNTSWQTTYLNTMSDDPTLDQDSNGNNILIFDSSPLSPGGNMSLAFSLRVESHKRKPPKIQFSTAGNLGAISNTLRQKYCVLEGTWVIDNNLQSFAHTIWTVQNKTSNVLRIVVSLADWIGSHVQSVSHDIPYYPNETYHYLEGDCDDQANLLIALCRVLGIPAYLQIGGLRWLSSTEKYWGGHLISQLKGISYHAWAMIFVPPWGWLPFDMTLGWEANNQLSVIQSAQTWSPNTIVLSNITKSNWAEEGRLLKELIMANAVYVYHEDELILADDLFVNLISNNLFLSGQIVILIILLSFWFIKRFRLIDDVARFSE